MVRKHRDELLKSNEELQRELDNGALDRTNISFEEEEKTSLMKTDMKSVARLEQLFDSQGLKGDLSIVRNNSRLIMDGPPGSGSCTLENCLTRDNN